MELHQFEQAILKLAFESQSRITTASVAYYLGIPSREANRMLNVLLEEGALELDSDENGNLFYRVPHQINDGEKLKQLRDAHQTVPERRPTVSLNATVDSDTGEAFSPIRREKNIRASDAVDHSPVPRDHAMVRRTMVSPEDRGPAQALPNSRHPKPFREHDEDHDRWGGFDDYYGAQGPGPDGASGRRNIAKKVSPAWSAVSSRAAATDGTVGSSVGNRYLVQTNARCEPQALASNRPVMTACDDNPSYAARTQTDEWFGNPRSTALVPAGSTALSTELDQPEHQPGMALLLSLILCGTGQMYNGEISKGLMMMVLCFLLWFVLLGWVVHIWSIVDAVVVAERLNRKQA